PSNSFSQPRQSASTGTAARLEERLPIVRSGAALFAGSGQEFVRMAPASDLTAHLVREFNARWGTVAPSEEQAWRRSLVALAHILRGSSLLEAGVGVELRLPLTDKRIDVSLVGR